VGWVDTELVLVALAAALSPTTLTFSVLALVLGDRPFRTGLLFWCGAVVATLGIGIVAAFVLGDAAASRQPSQPKTWVAVLDIVLAVWILAWVVRQLRKPRDPQRTAKMIDQMGKIASSPAIAVVGAGAALANPGAFIPIALKTISETNPSTSGYAAEWVFFTLVSVLPLTIALVLLVVMRERALRLLAAARAWLELHARTIAAVLVILVAASLLRSGIAGLIG
jgi:flagellar biogenesis protein FliO